jgi:hypothetical protein
MPFSLQIVSGQDIQKLYILHIMNRYSQINLKIISILRSLYRKLILIYKVVFFTKQ